MEEELSDSSASEGVLSPNVASRARDDAMLTLMKELAESVKANAQSFQKLAEVANKADRKQKRRSWDSDSQSGSPAKRKRVEARLSERPSGTNEEACTSAEQAVPGFDNGAKSALPMIGGDKESATNNLAKGSSATNAAKGKAVARGQGNPSERYRHEDELSELGRLEQEMIEGEEEPVLEEGNDLPILGGKEESNWKPGEKVWSWFTKVADIELKKEHLNEINEKYKHEEIFNEHFSPPLIPKPLWNGVKSTGDISRHRALFFTQDCLYSSLKPLLTLLEISDNRDHKEMLTNAIQLICSSNLQLNRFRRSMVGSLVNKDIKKSIFSAPVSHNSLFGGDFQVCG